MTDDIVAISQLASSITVSGVLLYAWLQERKERLSVQDKLDKVHLDHKKDLKEHKHPTPLSDNE